MANLIITTCGNVCFDEIGSYVFGLDGDVYCDEFGFPYLPISKIIFKELNVQKNWIINRARLLGYSGLIRTVTKIKNNSFLLSKLILSYYTETKTIDNKYYRMLTEDLQFIAEIQIPDKDKPKFEELIKNTNQIGINNKEVTGKVKITVDWEEEHKEQSKINNIKWDDNKDNYRLHYTIQNMSPISISGKINESSKSNTYISGKYIEEAFDIKASEIFYSNAYPVYKNKRSIPAPLCIAENKMHSNKLYYRLSPAPKKAPVIIKNLSEKYIDGMDKTKINCFTPSQKLVTNIQEDNIEVLSEGQCFAGFIDAPINVIKNFYNKLTKEPSVNLGEMTNLGFGESLIQITKIENKQESRECLCAEFDLYCVSPLIVKNKFGLASTETKDVQKLIENILNIKLKMIKQYKSITTVNGPTTCLNTGTCFRFLVEGSEPADISLLQNIFIGEKCNVGFGEIFATKADSKYYRDGNKTNLPLFSLDTILNETDKKQHNELLAGLKVNMLHYNITLLALDNYKNDHNEIPYKELSELLLYNENILSKEEAVDWYRNVMSKLIEKELYD